MECDICAKACQVLLSVGCNYLDCHYPRVAIVQCQNPHTVGCTFNSRWPTYHTSTLPFSYVRQHATCRNLSLVLSIAVYVHTELSMAYDESRKGSNFKSAKRIGCLVSAALCRQEVVGYNTKSCPSMGCRVQLKPWLIFDKRIGFVVSDALGR